MNIEKYNIGKKEVTLYHSEETGSPLVVLNTFFGDGSSVIEVAKQIEKKDFNMLCIGSLDWDHDMTPWYCPPLSPNDHPCTGGADGYLKLLVEDILPEALRRMAGVPSHISIAGYSLAGLFALYAMYHTDVFERAACISGSLWFSGFKDYVLSHDMKRTPKKLYLSLGDKEAETKNQYLRTVRENTECVVEHYKAAGFDVTWEVNPGNHFREPALRSAKGILAII